jgi:coatomer protein complex subunit alpha (xenin)
MSSTSIVIAPLTLTSSVSYCDGARIKSGAWFERIFVFSTKTHIKYLLPNGDSGIVKSLSERFYVAAVRGQTVVGINGDNEIRRIDVDLTEARFKAALVKSDMSEVSSILQHAKLCSESIVDYLQKRNHPEVALAFVDDPDLQFRLALSAGRLDVAAEAARRLNNPAVWEALAEEAIWEGRFEIAEAALVKSENLERLAFFLLISGQIQALKKLKVDDSLAVQRAIWLGDRPALAELLRDSAPALADLASQEGTIEVLDIPDSPKRDWPVTPRAVWVAPRAGEETVPDDGWEFDIDVSEKPESRPEAEPDAQEGWDLDIDIDLGDLNVGGRVFVPPAVGTGAEDKWARIEVAGAVVAAGRFAEAVRLLRNQIGLVDARPLRARFAQAFVSANGAVGGIKVALFGTSPAIGTIRESIQNLIDAGRKCLNSPKTIQDGVGFFEAAIQAIPLVICPTKADEKGVLRDIAVCRHYLTALALWRAVDAEPDKARKVALAAYLGDRELENQHKLITWQIALKTAFDAKAISIAKEFATRIVRLLAPNHKAAQNAQKILGIAKAADETKVAYQPAKNYEICCKSFTPIYDGNQKVCPYCGAVYQADQKIGTCEICKIAGVGATGTGLKLFSG